MALETQPEYRFDDYLAVEREAIDEKREYVPLREIYDKVQRATRDARDDEASI